jgi:predicted dehydrogenase/threonine dehydrogenase-like Zn-dependent dehydrogenase
MKQLAQRLKDGELRTIEVPQPELDDWKVLVRTEASLISAGTERAKVEVGRESLLGKAYRRPDQARQVLEKVRREGLRATVDAVRTRLEALSPLGYCAAGRVEQVGSKVRDVAVGDRVACGGEEAAHAELLAVPANLCVRVPHGVTAEAAAFTTLGSIALHGFRQADLRIGERVAIVGMGLVGQLAARIAKAAGCEVLGIDLDPWRLEVANRTGALDLAYRREDVADELLSCWDAVLVTADAPSSSDPVSLAVELARERGRIVVVGNVKLDLDRRPLYAKELEVRLARSYGPGRYDREYEERGLDYPIGYVRWTERRNMEAFLALLSAGKLTIDDLLTHHFAIADAPSAFAVLADPKERSLAIVLDYPPAEGAPRATEARAPERRPFSPGARIGFIGAGSFAQRYLIPLARRHGLELDLVATASGLSAASVAGRFGFRRGACTVDELLGDEDLAGVVVATRHDMHGRLALAALRAGKAVFVEKPLCLSVGELDEIGSEVEQAGAPPLFVGFNRRYAPFTGRIAAHLEGAPGPTNVVVRVAAERLADDHWLNDPHEGGGRLLGEGCHFLDLIAFLAGSPPVAAVAQARLGPGEPVQSAQDLAVTVRFADGSLGTLLYGTVASSATGKELVEAHRGGRSARLDDFQSLRLWGSGRPRTHRTRSRDKGHSAELLAFARAARGEEEAPSAASYLDSMRLTFAALRSLETGREERVGAQSGEGASA